MNAVMKALCVQFLCNRRCQETDLNTATTQSDEQTSTVIGFIDMYVHGKGHQCIYFTSPVFKHTDNN